MIIKIYIITVLILGETVIEIERKRYILREKQSNRERYRDRDRERGG